MNRAVMSLLGLALVVPVHAETISPALALGGKSNLPHWSEFVPPPAAFSLLVAGDASVTIGTVLDLRPRLGTRIASDMGVGNGFDRSDSDGGCDHRREPLTRKRGQSAPLSTFRCV